MKCSTQHNRFNKAIYSLTTALAVLGYAMPGFADFQAMDYGSLQSVFGEPVTTSVTGTPQRASDVPANMTIITADEIRQSGSRNLPDILSRVPGLNILQTSATQFDVGVRGYQEPFQPRLLVLIDGRQVFLDDYSRTEWQNLPVNIDDIRQIEVVKGASSALFGSNAAGGVINIVTYNPLYDKSRTANISYGTQETASADATYTQHFGSWGGMKVSAGGMTGQEFTTEKQPNETTLTNNPQHQYASDSAVFKLSGNVTGGIEATYSNAKNEGANFEYGIQNTVDTVYSVRGGLQWQTPYGLLSTDNYYNHAYELAEVLVTPHLNAVNDQVVSQLQDQFRIGSDNSFRLGLEFRHKTSKQNALDDLDSPQQNELVDNIGAASGTWMWQINDKLSWTNAIRLDHSVIHEGGVLDPNNVVTDYTHTINAVSGNSGLVYHATDRDTIRVTYGQGVQLPSMIQNGIANQFILSGFVLNAEGNPLLKPTIVDNYEIDYDHGLPSIDSTARISAFYNYNKDLISAPQSIGAPRFINGRLWLLFESINAGDSHGVGSEVQIFGKNSKGFRWDFSYSWSSVADASTVANIIDYQKSAPESQWRALLGYTTGPWEFDANGQYVTATGMLRSLDGISLSPVYTEGYFSLSGRIGYNINENYTIALSGTNLTRADTVENPYPAVERQVFLGLTGRF